MRKMKKQQQPCGSGCVPLGGRPTDLVPQHALQPVLAGGGGVDGQRGPAVHHRHGGPGQEVVCHLDHDLPTQVQSNMPPQLESHKRADGTALPDFTGAELAVVAAAPPPPMQG